MRRNIGTPPRPKDSNGEGETSWDEPFVLTPGDLSSFQSTIYFVPFTDSNHRTWPDHHPPTSADASCLLPHAPAPTTHHPSSFKLQLSGLPSELGRGLNGANLPPGSCLEFLPSSPNPTRPAVVFCVQIAIRCLATNRLLPVRVAFADISYLLAHRRTLQVYLSAFASRYSKLIKA